MRFSQFLLILLASGLLSGQSLPNRYQEDVFTSWLETSEVLFSENVPQPVPGGGFYEWLTGYPLNVNEFQTTSENLYMDIFQPEGDTLSQRPLMIICFGGGFVTGSKDHWSIRLLAEQLVKRGFVVATIDYRLGMNIFDADLSNRAVYRGIQDGRSAVRYFRADADGANIYKVDPDQIFIGGHSAGAFIATHNAYLDKESERPLSTYQWTQDGNVCPDLGCLDCAGGNQTYGGHANAVFSYAGALGFTDFIESSNDPRMVMFHSEDDGTVPYTSGEPFGDLLWLVAGADLPDVYGSSEMANQADIAGLTYEFYSYTNRGHGVHENDPVLYGDIIPRTEDWFYADRLKPQDISLSGDSTVCTDDMEVNYVVSQISQGYYDWIIDGALAFSGDSSEHSVLIEWESNLPSASLAVVPYSKWRARGDTLYMNISFQDNEMISWISGQGFWDASSNWTLSRIPQTCDDVELPFQQGIYEVTVPPDVQSTVRSLTVYPGAILDMLPGATVKIKPKE